MSRDKMKGVSLTPPQTDRVRALFLANPGVPVSRLKELVKEETGRVVDPSTIYRWLEMWNLPSPRQYNSRGPVAYPEERALIARLLKQMAVPRLSDARSFWRLMRGGPHSVSTSAGPLVVFAGEAFTITSCWFTSEESESIRDVLGRRDRQRDTGLVDQFKSICADAAGYIDALASLERSLAEDPEWRVVVGAKTVSVREDGENQLERQCAEIEWRVNGFKSSVLLAVGM